jgi:hypothetical protein
MSTSFVARSLSTHVRVSINDDISRRSSARCVVVRIVRFSLHGSDSSSSQTINPSDSDLDADVNTLPNLDEFIHHDILQTLYQSREWKFQTTINELIHTERTHLKSLKIMKRCFREPMERFPGMSPVEIDCIFRNLDQLIHLHSTNN